jgi:transposase
MGAQPNLLEIPEQPRPPEPSKSEAKGAAKLRRANRQQTMVANICVEELIPGDHKARAIWHLAGALNLERFAETLKTKVGQAGRPAWDPRLLVSVWVYAYSEGIGSAREVERLAQYERGFQWLCGLVSINHHTLSSFRLNHKKALDNLFAQVLGLLEKAQLLDLEHVMHDGTKIRAHAGADSFRRQKTVEEHLARARNLVKEMGDPRENRSRREAAQQRVACERAELLERAAEELKKIQQTKDAEEREAARVSMTEPEARLMKHSDGAFAPSYNVQISTDAKEKVIVGVHLSQNSSDAESLPEAVAEIENNLGRQPKQVVVDGGFTNRGSMEAMAEKKIELIGSLTDKAERSATSLKAMGIAPEFGAQFFILNQASNTLECPAHCQLKHKGQRRKDGHQYQRYQARREDCAACEFRPKCCPKSSNGRLVSLLEKENEAVAAMRQRMETAEAKAIYKQRGAVAEFPNAWLKTKIGLRKFNVRGKLKAATETVWACLTYNMQIWIRLRWEQTLKAAA